MGMAAESRSGPPGEETISVTPETKERLRGLADTEQRDGELLRELLDRVEQDEAIRTGTWPTGDYY